MHVDGITEPGIWASLLRAKNSCVLKNVTPLIFMKREPYSWVSIKSIFKLLFRHAQSSRKSDFADYDFSS